MKTRRSISRHSLSNRSLNRRSLRAYRDARAIRSFKRFNDGVVETLAEKARAACAKAIEWCREKKAEHPKLAKLIVILLKIDGSLKVLVNAGLTGFAVGTLVSQRDQVKKWGEFASAAGLTPLRVILTGLLGLLGGILKIAAANKIESL